MRDRRGFTLVELAIVLVIIGLLVGGILVAQSMIRTAKTHKIIRTAEQYQAAARNFKTTYGYSPGIYPKASFGCAGNGTGINGTGMIGFAGDGNTTTGITFFSHLSAANFIPNILRCPANSSDIIADTTVPAGLDKDFRWTVHDDVGQIFSGDATMLNLLKINMPASQALTSFLVYNKYCTGNDVRYGCGGIVPADALSIDKKVDDGMPFTGNLIGIHVDSSTTVGHLCYIAAANSSYVSSVLTAATYDVRSSPASTDCAIGFKLDLSN